MLPGDEGTDGTSVVNVDVDGWGRVGGGDRFDDDDGEASSGSSERGANHSRGRATVIQKPSPTTTCPCLSSASSSWINNLNNESKPPCIAPRLRHIRDIANDRSRQQGKDSILFLDSPRFPLMGSGWS